MNSQNEAIRSWLATVFDKPEDIPHYELNAENLSVLMEFASACQERERLEKNRQDLVRRQKEEYKAEAEKLEKVVALVDSPGLNSQSQTLVDILAQVADLLDCDDPSPNELSLLLYELKAKVSKIPVQMYRKQNKLKDLQAKNVRALKDLSQTQVKLGTIEKEMKKNKVNTQQSEKKMEFLKEKQVEYAKTVAKYESVLHKNGYRPELEHEALMAMKEQMDDLQNTLKPLKAKLESYQALPPNVELAKAKVAEAQAQLLELTHQLTHEISTLHI
ncbi:hypothetical protein TCAL_07263 [Tigriopus californicus]|uniref:HAUS augmin-like complex subunit 1 n=1 Tax=Tigriopus californicus TaxID=6832 RepID=A0A553NER5_TIGCA|nr:HAUS augmin-like complex subunit 1 [Tigriopus californicus]TRY63898.1 hypothetical protein TCAL_07263 [Tigriopus californicus]|eukprot:TCALIF_07263-PA protein Name:"Similar to Haus1 HAUS augmin-like complex subunit 1 (Rattus norvegicus)" AED:0.37 eAED:0.37 QI:0/-1/0/1/-1/1/1/0/273